MVCRTTLCVGEQRRKLDHLLITLGYSRSGRTWRKPVEQAVFVVLLQKSRTGEDVMVKMGSYLTELGDIRRPRFQDCHVRFQLDIVAGNFYADKEIQWMGSLGDRSRGPDHTMFVAEKKSELIARIVRDFGLELLSNLSTLANARVFVTSDARARLMLVDTKVDPGAPSRSTRA